MNKIEELIKSKESKGLPFRPTQEFYDAIQINSKRFGLLRRNEKPATVDELKRIADYFEIPLKELIEI
ncbi:MAG TPA: hypothetical protein DCG75_16030 [Bacteroidales bacterium]|nr:hypothetical protein [Bacteroidales bacterium]